MKRSGMLIIGGVAAGIVWAQNPQPAPPGMAPEQRAKYQDYVKRMGDSRGEGKLKAGDPAPDFQLKQLHSERVLQLSQFKSKKPVALVFGSYT